MLEVSAEAKQYSREMMNFIDQSPSPFHAVASAVKQLEQAGYQALSEKDVWSLQAGQKYYVIRGGGSLIAWIMGTGDPAEHGARLVGAHTDSPNILRWSLP